VFRGVDENGNQIFRQKRVDIMLGVDMVLPSLKQRVSKVALLSGDRDFTPRWRRSKQKGSTRRCGTGAAPSRPAPATTYSRNATSSES